MGLGESIYKYGESITLIWVAFLFSIVVFSVTNRRIYAMESIGIKEIIKHYLLRVLAILPVAILFGIRSYFTGADTHGVWGEYLKCSGMDIIEVLSYDITAELYYIVSWIIAKITNNNVQVFLFTLAFFTLYILICGIEKWELKYSGLALFVFYSCLGLNLMNQARQMLAVVILFYGYYFVYNGYYKKYFILLILAGMIHLASIPAGIIIYLINHESRIKQKAALFFAFYIVILLGSRSIIRLLTSILPIAKYYQYYFTAENNNIGLGLVLICIPTVFITFMLRRYLKDERTLKNTIYFTLPVRLTGYTIYFVYRLYYYFSIQNVIALPLALERVEYRYYRVIKMIIILSCLIWFFLYYCWSVADVYFPYETFIQHKVLWY